ncbi:MAG: hypothetical protein IJW32_01630 [Clostridia bacterium]|nr:hypothetical protein [Clostridia bacterium]
MAIVEMLKLKLYGANADKQKLLDALFATKLVQLKDVEDIDNTSIFFDDQNYTNLDQQRAKLEKAILIIEDRLDQLPKKQKEKLDPVVDVTQEEFMDITNQKGKLDQVLNSLDELLSLQNEIKKEKTNLENKISQLLPYVSVKESFSDFKNTKNTTILLGSLSLNAIKEFDAFLQELSLTVYDTVGDGSIIKVYSHSSESEMVVKKLNELGFSRANFELNTNAEEEIKSCQKQIKELDKQEKEISQKFCLHKDSLKDLKVMHDYLRFLMEKESAENKFRCTSQAFVLEAYLPKNQKEKVEKKLNRTSDSIEFEFCEIDKNEMPPTITKNNPIVSQFEFVTNMYSAPHYREFDPNTFIAIFFSIFFGFVMADIGYGLCLMFFGFFMAYKQKRKTGFRQLMNVVCIGGIFTIIFGILFGSFFGVGHDTWAFVPEAIMPDPVNNVITLLVACLAAGVVQIMVSFILKGILLIKNKQVWSAIFTAFAWDFFFVGLAMFALEFAGVYVGLGTIGIIIALVSVGISVIGTALISKGVERFTKAFGALYGIINLFSDILSYARLFGLMLSGAIIGSIVNDLASGFLTSPVTFIVGVIILGIGHSFNLAMGALGGYIHVARLQYIEFFSRFYEGEGELFVPFGNNFSYINLI